jgi:hypothetical protein
MRMTQLRVRSMSKNFINSPKTTSAIPTQSSLHRDLVVQSALDPHVRSIEFLTEVRHRDTTITVNSIVLRRDDGNYMLEIPGRRRPRDVNEENVIFLGLQSMGLSLLEIDTDEIRREPRLSNAREIWGCKDLRVPIRDRMHIMTALSEDGPQSILTLQDIVPAKADLASSLCALACADLVEIDMDDRPLGPHTLVRARR